MLRAAATRMSPKLPLSSSSTRLLVSHTIYSPQKVLIVRGNTSKATPTPGPEPQKPKVSHNPDWSAPMVSYEEVKARVRKPVPGTYLIDVREKDEVAQGMIPTAVNIPLSDFIESIRLPADKFHELHGFTKPRHDQEIVFYCRSGKRSATASDAAKDNGFTNVKNYSGSWLDWVKKTQENDYNL